MGSYSLNRNDSVVNNQITKDVRRGSVNVETTVSLNDQEDASFSEYVVDSFSPVHVDLNVPPSSIGGVTVAADKRFLVIGQNIELENGVHEYNGTIFNEIDIEVGQIIKIGDGDYNYRYFIKAATGVYKELSTPKVCHAFPTVNEDLDKYYQIGSIAYDTDSLNGVMNKYTLLDNSDGAAKWVQDWSVFYHGIEGYTAGLNQTDLEFHGKANTNYHIRGWAKFYTVNPIGVNMGFVFSLPSGASGSGLYIATAGANANTNNYPAYMVYPVTLTTSYNLVMSPPSGIPYGIIQWEGYVQISGTAGRVGVNISSPFGNESLIEGRIEWKKAN